MTSSSMCLLLLFISMDVELNPGPYEKAFRTCIGRHQQSIETKIQQLFYCTRQQGDTLNILIDHTSEQLHQVPENMVHDIQQLKKQHQEDRTSIDQMLEVQNSSHLRLMKLEEAMEKSESRTRGKNLKIYGIVFMKRETERGQHMMKNWANSQLFLSPAYVEALGHRVDTQNRADKRT